MCMILSREENIAILLLTTCFSHFLIWLFLMPLLETWIDISKIGAYWKMTPLSGQMVVDPKPCSKEVPSLLRFSTMEVVVFMN